MLSLADAATGPLVLALLIVVLTGLRAGNLRTLQRAPRTVAVAVGLNFVAVPAVAYVISSAVMLGTDDLRLGLMLYCLFPCTDWFLAFTRLADGDTAVGAALIPVNLALQLALYPVYLHVLVGSSLTGPAPREWSAILVWFCLPAGVALAIRLTARVVGAHAEDLVRRTADRLVPWVLGALVTVLFIAHTGTILAHPGAFVRVLAAVACFLVLTCALGEVASRRAGLSTPERTLVLMTTSARNAPLILGLTVAALPDRPLVHAAIVLGMLVELPHLVLLQHLLRRTRVRVPQKLAIAP